MALDPSSLKVTELRAELSSRKLPTKGKKDELIARLKEALENDSNPDEQNATENTAPNEEVKEISSEPVAPEEVEAKQDPVGDITDKPTETIVEQSAEKVIEKREEELIPEPTPEIVEKPKEEVIAPIKESAKKSSEKSEEQVATVSQEQIANKPSEELINKPTEDKISCPKVEASDDNTSSKRKLSAEDSSNSEEKRIKVDTAATEGSALYVKGFVRPLISRNVQELFSKYGKVKRFWMDFIKTHSYVIYETEEEANTALKNIDGIVFPQDTGKALTAGKLTSEQAEKLIDYEQAAASNHIRIEWEPLLEKVKAGESLAQSPGGGGSGMRVARSIGMGQIAKQLAQAAEPSSKTSRQITITAAAAVPKERSLDDLFHKTETLPHLYYLPVSDEEASVKLKSIQNL